MFLNFNTKSIRLHPNGFSLFKRENERIENQELPFDSSLIFSDAIRTFFDDENKETVSVIVNMSPPILIPRELYDATAQADYLKLHFDINDPIDIYEDEIENYYSIYFISKKINEILKRSGIDFQMTNLFTVMYQDLHQKQILKTKPNILGLFVDDQFVEFILEKEGQLQILNRFEYVSEYDILYFVLNLLKQQQISAKNMQMILYHRHHEKIEKLLNNYFEIRS